MTRFGVCEIPVGGGVLVPTVPRRTPWPVLSRPSVHRTILREKRRTEIRSQMVMGIPIGKKESVASVPSKTNRR